jgi:HEPN domain-containing protein
MPRTIPISKYVPKKFGKTALKNLSVFKLDAMPKSSPIDLDVSALSEESGWSLSDRLRFWHTLNGKSPLPATRLTIRKLELEEQALVLCHVEADGTLTILSNSKEYATRFFNNVFVGNPPAFRNRKDWKLKSVWVKDETTVAFFAGTAAGALGWGPAVPHKIEDSIKEALRGIEKRNWKSCVVMCRRALQALMEVAYEKFFGAKPGKGLDLNGIIRSFEKLSPSPIPRHWLNIADAVRNIGNVPGAHPRPIPGYRFSKGDATLAYSNTSSFVSAYFEKIAP